MVFDMATEKLSILALQAQVDHMGFLFLDLEYAPNTQLQHLMLRSPTDHIGKMQGKTTAVSHWGLRSCPLCTWDVGSLVLPHFLL